MKEQKVIVHVCARLCQVIGFGIEKDPELKITVALKIAEEKKWQQTVK